ncbi:hypothetical protein BGZ76_001019 [Entomortierella beljakovae]|nr:hypothetical protein BGZ76_001019 [Entomortierella beljakovae]
MEELPEDAFEVALDARSFVFLESIISLSRPLAQLQIESDDLESQWKRLQRGIREIDPSSDIYYMEAHHALEYGLETDCATRLNLATFAHEAFAENLDLDRCKRSLQGFAVVFPLEAEDEDKTLEARLAVFLQLVAIILVLNSRLSKRVTRQTIMESCNSKNIPELSKLSKMNITPVIDLAARVANNKKQLDALYNDTLKQIIKLVDQKLQSLQPIVASDFAEELREMRDQEMGQIYTEHSISPDDEFENETWIHAPTSEYQSAVKELHGSSILSDTPNTGDITHADDIGITHADDLDIGDHIDNIADNPMDLDESHIDQEIDTNPSEQGEYSIRVNNKREIEDDLDQTEQDDEYVPTTRRRRQIQIRDENDGFITDPDEAESSISIVIPSKKPRPNTNNITRPAGNGTQPVVKTRKPTVHWTDKEITRLLDLVDKFKYKESEIILKKRTVKWAKLKAHDEANGDILRCRGQVQLKDKYREILGRKAQVAPDRVLRRGHQK